MNDIAHYAALAESSARRRKAGGKASKPTKAYAGISTAHLLANLTEEQVAGIRAAGVADSHTSRIAAARAEGFAQENARCRAIMQSDEVIGRSTLAAKLIMNDKLSAEDVIAILASTARDSVAAAHDPEAAIDAARSDMRERLIAAQDASHHGSDDDNALVENMTARWSNVHAEVAKERGQ